MHTGFHRFTEIGQIFQNVSGTQEVDFESPKYYLGKHTPDPSRSFRLRHLFNYPALKSRKTLGDRSFFVAAPKLWNELPSDIRDLNSINRFKTAIKTYLFRQSFLQCLIQCFFFTFTFVFLHICIKIIL